MDSSQRLFASIAYIPVIGWFYILFFQRNSPLPMFHVRQSIGLVLFLLSSLVAWIVFSWVLAWMPFGVIIAVALFSLVILAAAFGVIVWISGIVNALSGRAALLPVFGRMANRLPL